MKVHLVGISGMGMGALAALLQEASHTVSGSDAAFDPPVGPALKALGIRCDVGFDPSHIESDVDLVIVGNAIRRDNPEALAAEARNLRRLSMSQALRDLFLVGRRPLVVAGTHGKTTTTALATWLLMKEGQEPGYFIGGIPKGFASGAAIGSTKKRLMAPRGPFVVEGDEYDAVYWHKQPKFLDYVGVGEDDVLILTSVEQDHIDIYPTVDAYEEAFRELIRRVPSRGLIVCDAHDARARTLVKQEAKARVVHYALERDDVGDAEVLWQGAPALVDAWGRQTFDLFAGGVFAGRYALPIPGEHNVRNAIAAIAATTEAFEGSLGQTRAHLATFPGVKRRQELLGEPSGVRVYDDFAHHPTAVTETLRALRAKHPSGKLIVAFEARSATACRQLHQARYAEAFECADRVLLAPLGRRLPPAEALDVARVAREIGPRAAALSSVSEIIDAIAGEASAGDTVALFSNGSFGGIHAALLERLASRTASV